MSHPWNDRLIEQAERLPDRPYIVTLTRDEVWLIAMGMVDFAHAQIPENILNQITEGLLAEAQNPFRAPEAQHPFRAPEMDPVERRERIQEFITGVENLGKPEPQDRDVRPKRRLLCRWFGCKVAMFDAHHGVCTRCDTNFRPTPRT